MKAHVICCNYGVMAVSLATKEDAKTQMIELANEDYGKFHYRYRSRDEYDHICYWHIHTVEVL